MDSIALVLTSVSALPLVDSVELQQNGIVAVELKVDRKAGLPNANILFFRLSQFSLESVHLAINKVIDGYKKKVS